MNFKNITVILQSNGPYEFRNVIIIFHSKLFYSVFTELIRYIALRCVCGGIQICAVIHSFTQKISIEHLDIRTVHVPNTREYTRNSKIILLGIDRIFGICNIYFKNSISNLTYNAS